MISEWFYSNGVQRWGPVTQDELHQLIASGQILPTFLVWRSGMPDWVEARSMPSLFPGGSLHHPRELDPLEARWSPLETRWPDDQTIDDRDGDGRSEPGVRKHDVRFRRSRRRIDPDEDDFEIRTRRPRKPGNVTSVGVMLLVGGILGILTTIGLAIGSFGVCCLWPGLILELVWSILAIIRGSNIMNEDSQGPPRTLLILQIICIINGDFVNCILGIVGLSMLNDPKVETYYRSRGFY